MPRGDRAAWGGRRVTTRPDAKPPGPPRKWRPVRLAESDARLLDAVLGGLSVDDALRRIAASAAADAEVVRAALAPHLAVEAWNGEDVV